MPHDIRDERFPIRELVRRTGVNASTLRAWENRHALLMPERTAAGHRHYGQTDVERVRRVQTLLAQGLSLGELATLLAATPGADAASAAAVGAAAGASPAPVWHGYLQATLMALETFSSERLDTLYGEACALYPIDIVTDRLLLPVLEALGQRWQLRDAGIAEEHFFSAWLRNKLGARLHHAAHLERGPQLILACLPHENHELGLLMFALLALQRGYRIIYLGANMPIRQLAPVARHTHPQAIVLAGRPADDARAVLSDIAWLTAQVAPLVCVGSHFADQTAPQLEALGAVALGSDMGLGMRLLELRLAERLRAPSRA